VIALKIKFTKMQAYGNDYVYIDGVNQDLPDLSKLAVYVSDRHFAIGSDGMVVICPSDKGDFRMRMFNPDGSEGEMCGNALRSVGKFVYDHRMTEKTELVIETLGGMQKLSLEVTDGFVSNITACIGNPRLSSKDVPVNTSLEQFIEQPVTILDKTFYMTSLSWGNPHTVMFLEDVEDFAVEKYGPAIEYHTELFPKKTNVTFAVIKDRNHIRIREWERGTGETIGCGTGCCTAVVAGVLTGRCDREVRVTQTGGDLFTRWDEASGDMYMTGISTTVFESELEVPDLAQFHGFPGGIAI